MEECNKCNFRFHTIGKLSAKIRMKRHMRKKHTIPCEICGKDFVSVSHKAVHKYLSHNLECAHCEKACEGYCSRYFSIETEKVGGKRMELTRQAIMDMVSRSENRIKEIFSNLNANYTKTLELCAYYMDVGFTNCYSTSWAMLLYYPAPEMPMIEMNEFTRWYVQQNLYTDALSKLENYLNKLNCTGLEKHIDKYRNFCPHFFSESDREVGAYKEYCQPEKEVYYEVSNRSVQTLLGARYLQSTNTAAQ